MPNNQLATNEQDESKLPVWKVIFSHLPYGKKVFLRNISKTFIHFFQELANAPFLSTEDIFQAANKIVTPMQVGLNDRCESFLVRIEPLPDSMDSVLISFEPDMMALDQDGNIIDNVLKTPLNVNSVLLYAKTCSNYVHENTKNLTRQYNTLMTREERSQFISRYLSLPNVPEMPRWKYLNSQSLESLDRLMESLSRYKDDKHKAIIPEVEKAIEAKMPVDLMKKLSL